MEKATHQPLVGLDATDGNLWFPFAGVRARCAASKADTSTSGSPAATRATELTVNCAHAKTFEGPMSTLYEKLKTLLYSLYKSHTCRANIIFSH